LGFIRRRSPVPFPLERLGSWVARSNPFRPRPATLALDHICILAGSSLEVTHTGERPRGIPGSYLPTVPRADPDPRHPGPFQPPLRRCLGRERFSSASRPGVRCRPPDP